MKEVYAAWIRRWEAAVAAAERQGGSGHGAAIKPPASLAAVETVEEKLGFTLSASFRQVLLEFSSGVEGWWHLPDDVVFPEENWETFGGNWEWDLSALIAYEGERRAYEKQYLAPGPPDNWLGLQWQDKLLFSQNMMGDCLAIDLAGGHPDGPVVCVSHQYRDYNGCRLADNFVEFIENLSLLGFVGPEVFQMLPFLAGADRGLDPYGESARLWRDWFGLDVEV